MTIRRPTTSVVLIGMAALLLSMLTGCPGTEENAATVPSVSPAGATPASDLPEVPREGWTLDSPAFGNGQRIPNDYTKLGKNLTPPLSWEAPPEDTQELVIICILPDASPSAWTAWVLYGLSPDVTSLPEGIPADFTVADPPAKQGMNNWGGAYGGPAPATPGQSAKFQFTLYAVSETLDLEPGAKMDEVMAAMEGYIIEQSTLEGVCIR